MGDREDKRAVGDDLIYDGVRETPSRYGANVAWLQAAEIWVRGDKPNETLDLV
jgi:hypothetical protein